MRLALTLAARELRAGLRGGLRGFRAFLLCLTLSVAAIAAVGLAREAIRAGLADQGTVLLGGDAQYEFTYRRADADERGWIADRARALSEVVEFRSMAAAGDQVALAQVKGVDDAYPLTGTLATLPPLPVTALATGADGVPGAFLDPVLAERLGLKPGDRFTLGGQGFELRATILREPDAAQAGLAHGPRALVSLAALEGTPLLAPGSLFETSYRVLTRPGQTLDALKAEALTRFQGAGLRWSDSRRPAPGVARFADQLAAFLALTGLAGLAVGGAGMSAATSGWIAGKAGTVATLRVLGATSGLIRAVFALQIAAISALGVAAGLALASAATLAAAGPIADALPFPAEIALWPAPLAQAAAFGFLAAALFTLRPILRMEGARAARLYRPDAAVGRIAWREAAALAGLTVAIAALACLATGRVGLSLAALAAIALTLGALALAAAGLRVAARAAAPRLIGRPILHSAMAALAAPGGEVRAAILSLGLGLTALTAIFQTEAALRGAIDRDLPKIAPAFFLLDLLPDQMDGARALLGALPGVSRIDSAPMLRGVIARINGRPARDVAGDHWVLRGDRGVTFADRPREPLTAGAWWPEGYAGPPLASFAAKEAAEIGLKLGDRITVNILGRDIEATIASFRAVDFSSAGIGFVLTLDPAALAGAPYTNIATVYADAADEPAILRALAAAYPNVTAIGVREAIGRLGEALGAVAQAAALAASVTLATGLVALVGAAAAGEGARRREAAILRTLGATRGTILASFALRAALAGAAAGLVASAAGMAASWAATRFVLELGWRPTLVPPALTILGGVALTMLAGVAFSWRATSRKPARSLRDSE